MSGLGPHPFCILPLKQALLGFSNGWQKINGHKLGYVSSFLNTFCSPIAGEEGKESRSSLMEIPKAKLLKLPFSRKHLLFYKGVRKLSNFYWFYSSASEDQTEQINNHLHFFFIKYL